MLNYCRTERPSAFDPPTGGSIKNLRYKITNEEQKIINPPAADSGLWDKFSLQ